MIKHVSVHRRATKQEHIAVVGDDAIHKVLYRKLRTLRFRFHRRRDIG